MSFEVRNKKLEAILKDIGHTIGDQMPKDYGFALFLFSYGEGGNLFYISSADRDGVIKTMKEFIAKQENQDVSASKAI